MVSFAKSAKNYLCFANFIDSSEKQDKLNYHLRIMVAWFLVCRHIYVEREKLLEIALFLKYAKSR